MKAPAVTTADKINEDATLSKRMIPENLPFVIKDLHKKALLVLLHRHHSGIFLTYSQLSQEIGIGEKTKRWQCEAWKHLKKHGYIVEGPEKRTFGLSKKGIELAACFATDEELEDFKPPASNDELHEKIRKQLLKQKHKGKKHKGVVIFDLLLEAGGVSKTRLELAWELDCNPDSHGFFYGFSALQKMGLVTAIGNLTREELKRKFESLQLKKEDQQEESKEDEISSAAAAAAAEYDDDDVTPHQEDNGANNTKEEYRDEAEQGRKTKKRKKAVRIRGGTQLFTLSKKAFLATSPPAAENINELTGSME